MMKRILASLLVAAPFSAFAGQPPAPVQSVAGHQGAVVLSHGDINDWAAATAAYLNAAQAAAAAPVQSVAGRAGAVTLTHGDLADWTTATSGFYLASNPSAFTTPAQAAAAAPVQSVAGRAGTVTLTHGDLADWTTATNGFYLATNPSAFTTPAQAAAAAPVQSVAGRTGAISIAHGDITDWAAATAGFGAGTSGVSAIAGQTGSITAAQLKTALAIAPADVSGFTAAAAAAAPVQTVAGRTGTVTLGHGDINDWASATAGFVSSAQAAAAAPVQTVAGRTGAIALTHGDLADWTSATSGFYLASNPSAFTTAAQAAAAAPVQTVAGRTGAIALTHGDITDWTSSISGFALTTDKRLTSAYQGGGAINVLDYGAVCDGTVHTLASYPALYPTLAAAQALYPFVTSLSQDQDWAAIQQAWNLAAANGGALIEMAHLSTCRTTQSINATNYAGRNPIVVDGAGATINGSTGGTSIIDALGSSDFHFYDLNFFGNATNPPSRGIQFGRTDVTANNSAGHPNLDTLTFKGTYTFAPVVNLASEDTQLSHVRIWNNYASGTASTCFGVVNDGSNHFNTTSEYLTERIPVDSNQSFNANSFVNGDVRTFGNCTPVWNGWTAGFDFRNVYVNSGSGYGMMLSGKNTDLSLNVHFEPATAGGLLDDILITGPYANPTLPKFQYTNMNSFATSYVLGVDTGISSITMDVPDLSIANSAAGEVAFQSPNLFTLSGGQAHAGVAALWNLPAAQAPCTTLDLAGAVTSPNLSCAPGVASAAQLPVFQKNGVAGLNADGFLSRDATIRPPGMGDDNTAGYSSGDSPLGSFANTVSWGDKWGYLDGSGNYSQWTLKQVAPGHATWDRVSANLPCDSFLQGQTSCAFAVSFYQLSSAFTGNVGTLYRMNGAGTAVLSQAFPAAIRYNDESFAAWDKFCAGTTFKQGNECKFIGNDQSGNAYASSANWGLAPLVTLASGGAGGANGTKTLTLNMAGCGTVGVAATIQVTVAGGVVQSSGITPTSGSQSNPHGECIGGSGSAVQTATNGGFTTFPTFNVVWFPEFAVDFPLGRADNNGLRGMVFNTTPFPSAEPVLWPENRVINVATIPYNSANAWIANLGTSLSTEGARQFASTFPDTATTPGGVRFAPPNGAHITALSGSGGCVGAVSGRTLEKQSGNVAVTIINVTNGGSSTANGTGTCWDGNDFELTANNWKSVSSAGMVIGASNASGTNSWWGDSVAILVGTTPASTPAGYQDLDSLRAALNQFGKVRPQSNIDAVFGSASVSANEDNESTLSWYRLALQSLRSGIVVKSYDIAQSGVPTALDLQAFYKNGGLSQSFFDTGCDIASTCILFHVGDGNDIASYVGRGTATSAVTSASAWSISGTTMTIATNGGGAVFPGAVLSGGTTTPGTTVVSYQPGTIFEAGNYTVTPSQTSSCSSGCAATGTILQGAQILAAGQKNMIWSWKNLAANGFVVWNPPTAGVSVPASSSPAFVAGDRVTFTPPTGITCQITTQGTPQTVNPVETVFHVNAGTGLPDQWIVPAGGYDHGDCFGSFTNGVAIAGWTPSGGTGSWGSATFSLTPKAMGAPKVIAGDIPLQLPRFNNPPSLNTLQPVALGGAGYIDDITANITNPQPAGGCPTITSCLSLGQGYGADAAFLGQQDPYEGPGVWSYTQFANQQCSFGGGEHPNQYCQAILAPVARRPLDSLIPSQ